MSDNTAKPDYKLDDILVVNTAEQFYAIGNTTRQKILGLLLERAATTSQLAAAFGQAKGTIAHHLKVLESAGLIHVVRTRQVRAITEKYYGRVARTLNFQPMAEAATEGFSILQQAINELVPSPPEDRLPMQIIRHARIPAAQARAFAERVLALAEEFDREVVSGEPVHGFVAAVYRTDWPELPPSAEEV
jgi:DNA-binding transcriptional ArsR family regulator